MILCLTNRMLVLAFLTAATTVMISLLSASADSFDENWNSSGTEITRPPTHLGQAPSGANTPVGNPVLAIPLSKLSKTRERPIFAPSRRPPPLPALPVIARQVEPTKPAEPEQPPLILVGTVAGGDSAIAVFVEQSTENTVRLRVNESHQGWTLRSIQGREVTLLNGRKSSVLALAPPGGSSEPASAQAALVSTRRVPKR